jgi:hypothetical protein
VRFLPHVFAVIAAFLFSKSLNLFPNGITAGMFRFEPLAVQGVFAALFGGLLGEGSRAMGWTRLEDYARDLFRKKGIDTAIPEWPDAATKDIADAARKVFELGYERGVQNGRNFEKGDLLKQLGPKVGVLLLCLSLVGCTIQTGPPVPAPTPFPTPVTPDQAVPADLQIEVDGVLRNLPVEVAWRYHGYYLVLSERLGEYPNTGAFGAASTKVRDRLGPGSPFKDIIDRRVGTYLNPPRQLNPTELSSAKAVLSQLAAACKTHAAARS